MYQLTTHASFDSAHFLSGYEGKCSNIHGHRWKLEVTVQSETLEQTGQIRGMVVDFGQLKDDIKKLADEFDHSLIIEDGTLKEKTVEALKEENFKMIFVDFRPTAESFAKYFYDRVKEIGYDVIGMVKKTPKMFFRYNGEDMSLISIYNRNKKRRGRSRYLLSVTVDVVKDGSVIPAKVVYVRNRNKRKEYLCLISTDITLSEEEIIRIYGKRWDIEVFFKVCKSYLNISKECRSMSYDAMTAHTAVVFTRYMMLSLENRESNDNRSLGELFLYFSDEMSDITWIQAFQMLLQMFRAILSDTVELSETKIDELVDAFMSAIPTVLKSRLQAV